MTSDDTITRRNVIKATSAAFAVGVGAVGSASAFSCAEMECAQTATDAEAYDSCGATSHVTTVDQGRSGFIQDTCSSDGVKYAKVDFDCTDTWWIECADLEGASDCFC